MHTGIFQSLTVCIRGIFPYGESSLVSTYAYFPIRGSPYAYGDPGMRPCGDRYKVRIWGSLYTECNCVHTGINKYVNKIDLNFYKKKIPGSAPFDASTKNSAFLLLTGLVTQI